MSLDQGFSSTHSETIDISVRLAYTNPNPIAGTVCQMKSTNDKTARFYQILWGSSPQTGTGSTFPRDDHFKGVTSGSTCMSATEQDIQLIEMALQESEPLLFETEGR
jgi:hypothetical protein